MADAVTVIKVDVESYPDHFNKEGYRKEIEKAGDL